MSFLYKNNSKYKTKSNLFILGFKFSQIYNKTEHKIKQCFAQKILTKVLMLHKFILMKISKAAKRVQVSHFVLE